jgi:type II protein arginine methyltransferase
MLPHQRKLYCGRTIAPSAVTSSFSGWDFGVVPLFANDAPAFSDFEITASLAHGMLVGLLSSEDEGAFERELSWGRHLMFPALICPLELAGRLPLLRSLRAHLLDDRAPPILVRAPWSSDGWRAWHRLRRLAGWHPRLQLCLEASDAKPDLDRFLAEPVDCLWIRGEIDHDVVRAFLKNGTERAICEEPHPRLNVVLQSLFRQAWSNERESVLTRFDEQLVPPVQPLRDHIPSTLYAVFERAVPKYERYAQAIRMAMLERKPAVVAVAGAGRGPLVHAVLQSARMVGQSPKVYAVEKNPNAVETLAHRNQREWRGAVVVAEADMRTWAPAEPVDLLVSELLGAFSDNELAPECLEGAERWLAKDGIAIPKRTVSYLAPAFAPRLVAVERPFGITRKRVAILAEPKPCFVFEHPNPSTDHRRFTELEFQMTLEAPINGFVGFFEAELFGDVGISTRPATATPNMDGWNTYYFPLSRPIESSSAIRCAFWRQCDVRRVWYEWAVLAPEVSAIHNAGGAIDSMSK